MTEPYFLMTIYDTCGVSGVVLQYALAIAFVSSAFLIFTGLWLKSRLDLDEAPKYQMLNDNSSELDPHDP